MRLAAVIALCGVLCVNTAFAEPNNLSGRRAPGFSLPDARFNRYDLQDYRGVKWVLIEFMTTKCPYCKELSKTLEQAKARYGDKVQVLAVVMPPDTTATAAQYGHDLGLTFPLLFDQGQVAASYFNATPENPTIHTPHLFVVDLKGTIVRDFGHSEENHDLFAPEGLFKLLDELFSGKAAPMPLKRDSARSAPRVAQCRVVS